MNDNAIIIDYDPFAMESRAYVMRDGNREESYIVASDISELTEKLVEVAKKHQVYNVRVRGPFAIMGEIKRSISLYEMKTYEENKITVEGL